jgi:hypothetical protein
MASATCCAVGSGISCRPAPWPEEVPVSPGASRTISAGGLACSRNPAISRQRVAPAAVTRSWRETTDARARRDRALVEAPPQTLFSRGGNPRALWSNLGAFGLARASTASVSASVFFRPSAVHSAAGARRSSRGSRSDRWIDHLGVG